MTGVYRADGPMYEGFRERASNTEASESKRKPTWRKVLEAALGNIAIVGATVASVAIVKSAHENQLKASYAVNIESDGYATVSGIGGAYELGMPKGRMRIITADLHSGRSLEEQILDRNLCASREQLSFLLRIAEQLNANPRTPQMLARGGAVVIDDGPTKGPNLQNARYLVVHPSYQCEGPNR